MKKLLSVIITLLITITALPVSVPAANNNILLGMSYTHNGENWYAERSTDTECTFLTDGITNRADLLRLIKNAVNS